MLHMLCQHCVCLRFVLIHKNFFKYFMDEFRVLNCHEMYSYGRKTAKRLVAEVCVAGSHIDWCLTLDIQSFFCLKTSA